MMIWKFVLPYKTEVTLPLPKGTEILHIADNNGITAFWALVDPKQPAEDRTFVIVGTGSGLPYSVESLTYLGTVQEPPTSDGFVSVWHVFEVHNGQQ